VSARYSPAVLIARPSSMRPSRAGASTALALRAASSSRTTSAVVIASAVASAECSPVTSIGTCSSTFATPTTTCSSTTPNATAESRPMRAEPRAASASAPNAKHSA